MAQNLLARTVSEDSVETVTTMPLDGSGRNRPGQIGGVPLGWDAQGNLTQKGDQTFHYDYRNRLIRVTGSGGTEIASYTYDAFNRRTGWTAGGTTEETVWAGWQAIERYDGGQLAERRTYGVGLDEIVRLETDLDGNGILEQSYTPVYDQTGNLTLVADEATGKVIERYDYTPYGERTIRVDSTPPEVEQVRVKDGQLWLEISEGVLSQALQDAVPAGNLTLTATASGDPVAFTAAQPVQLGRQASRRIVLTPATAPAVNAFVELHLQPEAIVDPFGNELASAYVLTFTWPATDTVLDDTEAPEIGSVRLVDRFVEIELTEEPELATVATAVTVEGQGLTWSLAADRYTVRSLEALTIGEATVTMNVSLADLAGTSLAQPLTAAVPANDQDASLHTAADPSEAFASAVNNRFGFHGRDHDPATGRVYFRHRWLDPELGRFITQDPLGYVDSPNLYQFALNSPVNFSDPMGLDAIAIAFVDYRIAVGDIRLPYLGHAAVVTLEEINRSKAMTEYFEYGRYDAAQLGEAHNRSPIPNVDLGANGLPTKESLKTLLQAVVENYGQSSRIEAAYFVTDEDSTSKMTDYAWQCVKRNEDPTREPYSTWSNNCGTFVEDVIEAGEEKLPLVLDPRPNARVVAWQSEADFSIEFDPETGKLDVPEEFFTANKKEILRWKALPPWKRVFTEKPH